MLFLLQVFQESECERETNAMEIQMVSFMCKLKMFKI